MIDVHDPIRILTVVEQKPETVLNILKANPKTFEWYDKDWMKLAVYNPLNSELYILVNGSFKFTTQFKSRFQKLTILNALLKVLTTIYLFINLIKS